MQIRNYPCLECGTAMPIDIDALQEGQQFVCRNPECGARSYVTLPPPVATAAPVAQPKPPSSLWDTIGEVVSETGSLLGEVGKQVLKEHRVEIIAGTLRWLLVPEKPKKNKKRSRRSG